jgi:hypothetical protein
MRPLPPLATTLLLRLGPDDESFAGDLAEEYAAGRSRAWYWRQVLSAIALTAKRQIGLHPVRAAAAVLTGWATLLLVFFTLGDRLAWGLASWIWNSDRQTAYATGDWWPFAMASLVVSYSGFALSALAVVRACRRQGGAMLVAYAVSTFVALIASAVTIEVLTRLWGRVPVPHTLFYAVSVALPYRYYSGLLMAPAVILIAGLLAARRSPRPSALS